MSEHVTWSVRSHLDEGVLLLLLTFLQPRNGDGDGEGSWAFCVVSLLESLFKSHISVTLYKEVIKLTK